MKAPTRIALLLCLLFAGVGVRAETLIRDPLNLLAQLNEKIGTKPLQETLLCGETVTVKWLVDTLDADCDEESPIQTCWTQVSGQQRNITRTVANCSAEGVSIYSDDGTVSDLTPASFDQSGRSLAHMFLRGLEEFITYKGVIELQALTTGWHTLYAQTPREKKIPVYRLEGTMVLDYKNIRLPIVLSLAEGVPGVAQVASFRISGYTWFRLEDYKTAKVK